MEKIRFQINLYNVDRQQVTKTAPKKQVCVGPTPHHAFPNTFSAIYFNLPATKITRRGTAS